MTVGELIQALKQHDKDLQVTMPSDDGFDLYEDINGAYPIELDRNFSYQLHSKSQDRTRRSGCTGPGTKCVVLRTW
ncbi:MAG: hypothetical protein DWQ19_10795 [Crenarchaeota archaeon]|nr:MAG: hypothetical protein DWQ19_10795 [Thermoproteota archaeon]